MFRWWTHVLMMTALASTMICSENPNAEVVELEVVARAAAKEIHSG